MIYHKDVFLPRRIVGLVPKGIKELVYSRHAKQEFKDKNGQISPPTHLDFAYATLVEVTTAGKLVTKLVMRKEHDADHDVVLVMLPTESKKHWWVKTVWLNKKNDNHSTLQKNRFPQ